ncbi:hypothetical protein [Bacillus sp. BP-3]|uniref:hypothetical protein n=1 Tax=Bacillus sp. BP-3 TaxID=3022773 RepID=UPI00232AD606|nr:hypothetical protein [Bacillus sp. BP-3]MDC2867574.1 hypothetical protein [Bacillus sp. BP-3]
MEVHINNITIESTEVMSCDSGLHYDTYDVSTIISYVVYKNRNKLTGELTIGFEQYKKKNHEELIDLIKELIS